MLILLTGIGDRKGMPRLPHSKTIEAVQTGGSRILGLGSSGGTGP
jgi:hypothetical protein